ncbi:hypothetical protein CJ030_MR7G026897 [Morella rubra]|uniref:TIR domain-containing protein n=1 Tax=Morella rubra TaxID=262757 RepID=A0A6A1V7S7_9ROSI|nr:hypothetical protein CJ030_MR7G026897 [Morella rubra]
MLFPLHLLRLSGTSPELQRRRITPLSRIHLQHPRLTGETRRPSLPQRGWVARRGPSLLEAIEDSAASIAIDLSPDFVSLPQCLEILSKICECRSLLLPVFCGVTPPDVRRQGGHLKNSLGTMKRGLAGARGTKVKTWRRAMKKAAGRNSGWVFNNRW